MVSSAVLAVVGAWYLVTFREGRGLWLHAGVVLVVMAALGTVERWRRQGRKALGIELVMRYLTLAALVAGIVLTGPTADNPFLSGFVAYVTVGAIRRGYAGAVQSVAAVVAALGVVLWIGGVAPGAAEQLQLLVLALVLLWVAFTVAAAAERGMRVQARLEQSERRYHSLFEITPQPVMLVDLATHQVLEANPRFWSLVGRSLGAAVSPTLPELSRDPAVWVALLRELYESESFMDREVELAGGGLFLVSGRVFRLDGRPVGVLALQDISAQRALEHNRQMEALGALAGGVAHEFNNLLAGVVGHGSVLLAEHPELGADLGPMIQAGERGARMARQLLAFTEHSPARGEGGVSLGTVVQEVAEIFDRTLGRDRLPVAVVVAPALVAMPEQALRQVVLDLLVHAHEAGAERVTLEVGVVGASAALPSGSLAELRVLRAGGGEASSCPWCGLERVQRLVRAARGALASRGDGALVVALPLAGEASAVGQGDRRGRRLLVVDDDPVVLRAARRILERGGHVVSVAQSGAEGLSRAGEGEVELVVMDVVMPGLDGPATWRQLHARYPELRVLFTSGFADKRTAVPADVPFLPKPYTLDALLDAVELAMEAPG